MQNLPRKDGCVMEVTSHGNTEFLCGKDENTL